MGEVVGVELDLIPEVVGLEFDGEGDFIHELGYLFSFVFLAFVLCFLFD